jgi:hypothetical protein
MVRQMSALVLAGAVALAGGIYSVAGAVADGPRGPADPGEARPTAFDHPRQNPWYPLRPGTVTVLRGTDDGEHLRERVRVTHRHKTIDGVRTTVVRDVLRRADGTLAEMTTDWYAADNEGNVWYFGERTATYDDRGHLESREGSWQAGVRGARAGLIMPADPHPTDAYRQEYFPGHAEDQAWIVSARAHVRTPLKSYRHAVRSFEWSRLEPGVMSVKFYGRGVGIVREHDLSGGNETFAVVAAHR